MSETIFVPLIVYGRDKYEYHAISCGLFTNKYYAVIAILKKLVEIDFISFDFFQDWLSDMKTKIIEGNLIDDFIENIEIDNLTKEQFIQYLIEKLGNNLSNLNEICEIHGDSYYKDGWDFQIDEHELQTIS